MKNLVLGVAKGYSFEQLLPFVASLRRVYAGDVCLLYSDITEDTIEGLQQYNIDLVPFTENSIDFGFKRSYVYQLLNRLHQSPLNYLYPTTKLVGGLVNLVSRGSYVSKSRIAIKLLNVFCVRFPLYYLYLLGKKYDNVMLTDVRDVIFQRDPFDFDLGNELCVFLEDRRTKIRNCPFNAGWLSRGFSVQTLEDLGQHTISCSGVTIGSYDAVLRYLEAMIDHMIPLRSHEFGIDQGVHNFLFRKRLLKDVRVYENGRAPVFTMGRVQDLPASFNDEGFLLNEDGTIPNVLHQYDRHLENRILTMNQHTFKFKPI